MSTTLGTSFGKSVSSYVLGRKNYPDELFSILSSNLSKKAQLLELGCGTGHATIQLYEHGFHSLIATDIDPIMLQEAKICCPNITFHSVDANAMPYQNNIFDSIVAFGSFHWFCNDTAISEIKRVLKKHGLFFVVYKLDTGSFRKLFKEFLGNLTKEVHNSCQKMCKTVFF